jgi:glycosyltransferase involved in cell wall biosynthesis
VRVTLVTDELLGYTRTGGIGTATTFLALALGRLGHEVELLYGSEPPQQQIAGEWGRLYDEAGVGIRTLPRSDTRAEPSYFGRMRDVERALAAAPPDVVIVQDLAAPAYTAIRMRTLGLAFDDTLFVVYCHGTRQWITDAARKVRVLPGALGITMLEQASIELADVVVSPSRYVIDWMQGQGWQVPADARVIPHLTRSVATGEPQPRAVAEPGPVRRIAFFGRLEERKGIVPFIEGVNALPPELLERIDVEFIGRATPAWTPERVRARLSDRVRASFATELDQHEALERLARPGTLAVMPSFAETFGNTVRECLDYGIPLRASTAAAIEELVAPEDRRRALFDPTSSGIASALQTATVDPDALRPVRPAFDIHAALPAWEDVLGQSPTRTAQADLPEVGATAPFALLLDGDDEPSSDLLEMLRRAQAASGADVVTCGAHIKADDGEALRFFHGEPGALGLLFNGYGTSALVRRSLLGDSTVPTWPTLADLAAGGARIVSVPAPLVTRRAPPATIERQPEEALLVAERFERAAPESARSLARLAAGLAAASTSTVG